MKIKVTPYSFGMKAPYQVINVDNHIKNPITTAENQVRENSALSRFKTWVFFGEKI